MLGAILGDIIGSPYEFDRGEKTKDFPLFTRRSHFTDDSVMTVAVAEAVINAMRRDRRRATAEEYARSMREWGREFPDAGYGGMFSRWLVDENMGPYGSYGNGSAMRVSPIGWLYDSLEETREAAADSAKVTHNHPEGIKGAEAVASVIYLARTGNSRSRIRRYVEEEFGYDLSRTLDDIRPGYHHVESCQETVPEAITAFLEGKSFEDVIRNAVSLGGDTDTLACIAGSMAEAYFGVPEYLYKEVVLRWHPHMRNVYRYFTHLKRERWERNMDDMRTIKVAGTGTVKMKPDMIRIGITVTGIYKDYSDALKKADSDTAAIRDIIENAGFKRDELKTTDFHVEIENEGYMEDGVYKQRFAGYRSRHEMKLEMEKDNGKLGEILGNIASSDPNPELSVTYFIKDRKGMEEMLIEAAVKDARIKARIIAGSLDVALIDVVSVDASDINDGAEIPVFRMAKNETMSDRAMGSYDMEMAPDDIETSATVTVVWKID